MDSAAPSLPNTGRGFTPWLLAARPKTLGAAIAPVVVGSVLGWKLGGQFCVWLMLATLGSCICLQIATNLFNDAVDHLKGSDTKARLGPVRITASGMMPARTVLWVAVGFLAFATVLSVPLIIYRGWPILAIGIPSLWFCYGYTGGPMPLAYRGLGELFVVLFFGLIAVMGSAYVQSGRWHFEAIVAGIQVGMLSTVLIAINNLRDIEEDTRSGKRTLAVRFGRRFARVEITLLLAVPYLMQIWWWRDGWALWWCPLQLLPIVIPGIAILWRIEPSEKHNRLLAAAGVHLIGFAALMVYTFLPGRWPR